MVRFLRIKGKLFMMQRMSARHLILALFLLTLAGCKKNYVFNEDLSILFQYEYRNDTDMKKHHGFIITGKGDVLEYNNPTGWQFPDSDGILSGAQVAENIGLCTHSGITLNEEELKKHSGLISNISSSRITAIRASTNRKTGTTAFYCYQVTGKDYYKQYVIKTEGDYNCDNLNFFSKKVITWMKDVNNMLILY